MAANTESLYRCFQQSNAYARVATELAREQGGSTDSVAFTSAAALARWWWLHDRSAPSRVLGDIADADPAVHAARSRLSGSRQEELARWVSLAWPSICARAQTLLAAEAIWLLSTGGAKADR